MESLESFDRGKGTPVDGIDVPDSNGTKNAAEAIAKQSNGDDTQHNSGRAQRQVVEEVLCREHGNASGSVRCGRGSDGAYCVLFQIPRPRVQKSDERDPSGRFAPAASLPPSSLVSITTREKGGPCFANKVGDEDDKSPRDGD